MAPLAIDFSIPKKSGIFGDKMRLLVLIPLVF